MDSLSLILCEILNGVCILMYKKKNLLGQRFGKLIIAEETDELGDRLENKVCEKGYRNHPLTEEQKKNNRQKSKIRCRIEHIFGFITGSMHSFTVRTIGIARAEFNIGITNLVYNMCRYGQITKR